MMTREEMPRASEGERRTPDVEASADTPLKSTHVIRLKRSSRRVTDQPSRVHLARLGRFDLRGATPRGASGTPRVGRVVKMDGRGGDEGFWPILDARVDGAGADDGFARFARGVHQTGRGRGGTHALAR